MTVLHLLCRLAKTAKRSETGAEWISGCRGLTVDGFESALSSRGLELFSPRTGRGAEKEREIPVPIVKGSYNSLV